MASTFTWERGPFKECPACGQNAFGILLAGGDSITMRCSSCRYSETATLPSVDKKVIYLDQSIFSILFKVASGGRLPPGHEEFSYELYRRLRRLLLLQQVVLPHSDIHDSETIVFRHANELREAYEAIGGDISLVDADTVELSQVVAYARAYIENREPELNFAVDDVLRKNRNRWLDDMRISVKADYSKFADGLRESRNRTHIAMQRLAEQWADEKPAFHTILERELSVFGTARRQAFANAVGGLLNPPDDPMEFFSAISERILTEFSVLRREFEKAGVSEEEQGKEVNKFWEWERNREQPHFRISAYLFSAFARRVTLGQKEFTRGLMNDVRAIATYAPYVDAMFVDRECASLLSEPPLSTDLAYKARIFSLSDRDAFLGYLDELERRVSPEVQAFATRIYGVK